MATTKRKPSLSRPAHGYRDAFDSFVEAFRSDQSRELARGASQILQISSSFKRIVDRLNAKYVSAEDERLGEIMRLSPDDEGVLTIGPFSGRRTLVFNELTPGNRFLRAGSFEIQTTAFPKTDFINISFPMASINSPKQRGKAIAQLIGAIAHETVHAFHRVTSGTTDPSLSRKARADAFIKEEIATREKEKAILGEILSPAKRKALETAEKKANSAGVREQIENQIATIKLVRAEVERDFVSGTQLTYLEMGVIDALIKESIRDEDHATMGAKMELVKSLVFTQPLDKVLQSAHPMVHTKEPETGLKVPFWTEFAELLLVRRLIEAHWSESGDERELILQQHKKAFFPDEIQYTDLP